MYVLAGIQSHNLHLVSKSGIVGADGVKVLGVPGYRVVAAKTPLVMVWSKAALDLPWLLLASTVLF